VPAAGRGSAERAGQLRLGSKLLPQCEQNLARVGDTV